MAKRKRVAFLLTHPIQYYAPLFRYLTKHAAFELMVFYQSRCSVVGFADPEFGRTVRWDIDLVSGYAHEFLPSFGRDDVLSPLRPVCHGLWRSLRNGKFDALFVVGYGRLFHWYAMAAARWLGMRIYIRDDAILEGRRRAAIKQVFKRGLFGGLRRLGVDVVAAGRLNAAYFASQGFAEGDTHRLRWVVDGAYFHDQAAAARPLIAAERRALGLAADQLVFLFVGKFSERKGILDLLDAFQQAHDRAAVKPALLFIGDGALRANIEAAARRCRDVKLVGFKNQSQLPLYYLLADVLVLPSKARETWGLVVNEAFSVGTPAIVSDHVGCHADLVNPGVTGWVFREGDVAALALLIDKITSQKDVAGKMRDDCLALISNFTYRQNCEELESILEKQDAFQVSK